MKRKITKSERNKIQETQVRSQKLKTVLEVQPHSGCS